MSSAWALAELQFLVVQRGLFHVSQRRSILNLVFAMDQISIKLIQHICNLSFSIQLLPNIFIRFYMGIKLEEDFFVLISQSVYE